MFNFLCVYLILVFIAWVIMRFLMDTSINLWNKIFEAEPDLTGVFTVREKLLFTVLPFLAIIGFVLMNFVILPIFWVSTKNFWGTFGDCYNKTIDYISNKLF